MKIVKTIGLAAIIVLTTIGLSNGQTDQGTISIGYTSNNHVMIDLGFISNNTMYELDFSSKLVRGTKGEDMTDIINWDQYPGDYKNKGTFYSVINFGVGFQLNENAYLMPKLGYARKIEYKNKFNAYHILGDNGEYYLMKQTGSTINVGLEFDYISESGLLLGIEANTISGLGVSIGFTY